MPEFAATGKEEISEATSAYVVNAAPNEDITAEEVAKKEEISTGEVAATDVEASTEEIRSNEAVAEVTASADVVAKVAVEREDDISNEVVAKVDDTKLEVRPIYEVAAGEFVTSAVEIDAKKLL